MFCPLPRGAVSARGQCRYKSGSGFQYCCYRFPFRYRQRQQWKIKWTGKPLPPDKLSAT
ncbi:DUF3304 domain-containing protein [Salmonella enterica]|nr:DUF3304 domain-containing protein [Salmonella enterica]